MIGTPASTSFTDRRGKSGPEQRYERGRIPHPLTWPNVVCLDAPLVAVSWQWLFARSFDAPVSAAGMAALFLTAWLIYLGDRSGDCASVDVRRASSSRQRFCLKYRRAWLVLLVAVGVADAAVVATQLGSGVRIIGAAVALLAIAYLLTNQLRPEAWRVLPAKETAIGLLFAAGTVVPIALHLPSAAVLPWLLFAALCTMNCISIAVWERWLDHAQQRVSIATAFPRVSGFVLPALLLLAVTAVAAARMAAAAQAMFVCLSLSAALLALTHVFRRRIQPDVRTALADLVLLTPAALLLTRW
jgi:hypothetical protein